MVNRYFNRTAARPELAVPDVNMISKVLDQAQKQSDFNEALVDQVKDIYIEALPADRLVADQMQENWKKQADAIATKYNGNYFEAEDELKKLVRSVKDELGHGGKGKAISDNAKIWADALDYEKKRLEKGEVSSEQVNLLANSVMSTYQGVGDKGLTGFNKLNVPTLAKFVDESKLIDESFKQLKPKKIKRSEVQFDGQFRKVITTEDEGYYEQDLYRAFSPAIQDDQYKQMIAQNYKLSTGQDISKDQMNEILDQRARAHAISRQQVINSTILEDKDYDKLFLNQLEFGQKVKLQKMGDDAALKRAKMKEDREDLRLGRMLGANDPQFSTFNTEQAKFVGASIPTFGEMQASQAKYSDPMLGDNAILGPASETTPSRKANGYIFDWVRNPVNGANQTLFYDMGAAMYAQKRVEALAGKAEPTYDFVLNQPGPLKYTKPTGTPIQDSDQLEKEWEAMPKATKEKFLRDNEKQIASMYEDYNKEHKTTIRGGFNIRGESQTKIGNEEWNAFSSGQKEGYFINAQGQRSEPMSYTQMVSNGYFKPEEVGTGKDGNIFATAYVDPIDGYPAFGTNLSVGNKGRLVVVDRDVDNAPISNALRLALDPINTQGRGVGNPINGVNVFGPNSPLADVTLTPKVKYYPGESPVTIWEMEDREGNRYTKIPAGTYAGRRIDSDLLRELTVKPYLMRAGKITHVDMNRNAAAIIEANRATAKPQ